MDAAVEEVIGRLDEETELDWGKCEGVREMIGRKLAEGLSLEDIVAYCIGTLRR